MTSDWERSLDPSQEWQDLMDRIDEAAAAPTDEKFVAVGEAAMRWAAGQKGFPRDVTLHSGVQPLLHKESPVHTQALDHLGRELVLGENGATTVEATLDEGQAVDGLDQQ